MYEFINNNSSSSSAAGAGGGSIRENVFSLTTSENMIFLYLEDSLMKFVIYDFTNDKLNGPTILGEYTDVFSVDIAHKAGYLLFVGNTDNEYSKAFLVSPKGDILITSNVKDILGYDESDLLGKSAYDFFNPECLLNIVKSHVSKNTTIVKYRIRSKNGDYIYVKTTSYKMKDDSIYCITRKMSFFEILIKKIQGYCEF